jgi:hypothetical protein
MPKIPLILATAMVSARVVTFALRFSGAEVRTRTQVIAFVLLAAGLVAGMLVWGR